MPTLEAPMEGMPCSPSSSGWGSRTSFWLRGMDLLNALALPKGPAPSCPLASSGEEVDWMRVERNWRL